MDKAVAEAESEAGPSSLWRAKDALKQGWSLTRRSYRSPTVRARLAYDSGDEKRIEKAEKGGEKPQEARQGPSPAAHPGRYHCQHFVQPPPLIRTSPTPYSACAKASTPQAPPGRPAPASPAARWVTSGLRPEEDVMMMYIGVLVLLILQPVLHLASP